MKHFYKYLTLALVFAIGCGKDEFVPSDPGFNYFPIQKNTTWIYQVDETVYSEVNEPQELSYQLKMEVTDSTENNDGTYTYIIHRSTRNNEVAPWSALDTWSIRKTASELVVIEGNISYRKLKFPLVDGLSWDGNAYNSKGEDEYEITDFNGSAEVQGVTFENTLTVEQEDNEDFIVFLDERHEVYAKDVGLISKDLKQLNYCTSENCVGQQQIRSGRILKQEIISYEF